MLCGGCGCHPAIGDGAGLVEQVPLIADPGGITGGVFQCPLAATSGDQCCPVAIGGVDAVTVEDKALNLGHGEPHRSDC